MSVVFIAVTTVSCDSQKTPEKLSHKESIAVSGFPQPIALSSIQIQDRLLKRSEANFMRLHMGRYVPEYLHQYPSVEYHQEEWPGDMAGRLILSLTLLEQSLKKESPNLKAIIKELPSHLNEKGYLGKSYSPMLNEQQLSGHGWLLRGISEYYLYTGDNEAKELLISIVNNLVLPTKGEHKNYPIDPAQREESGGYMGTHQKSIGNWILSSDVGCDFIFMDGVIKAYEILKTDELKDVVDEMISRFLEVDLVKIKAQTHATLTALRSILRYAEIINDNQLVDEVVSRFEIYKSEGMTENYENYNWFGRPLWTEPCAVVDSYITAINLWRLTGDTRYLEDAQLIYYNGIGFEERYDGGFGSSSCAGSQDPFIKPTSHDNHWCCTMRGSDGLAKAAEYSYFTKGDTIYLAAFQNNQAEFVFDDNKIIVSQKSNYPFSKEAEIEIIESNVSSEKVFAFFIPTWVIDLSIKINEKGQEANVNNRMAFVTSAFKSGDRIKINFDMEVKPEKSINKNTIAGYFSFHYGPLVLGSLVPPNDLEEVILSRTSKFEPSENLQFKVTGTDLILKPLNHLMHPDVRKESGHKEYVMQVMFKEESN